MHEVDPRLDGFFHCALARRPANDWRILGRKLTSLLAAALGAWVIVGAPLALRGEDLAEARRLYLKGRYAESADAYVALAEKHPVESAVGLARCRSGGGDYDEAREILARAQEQNPDSSDLPAELAILELARGEIDEASRLAAAALAINPDQLAARWVTAEVNRLSGRLDEAETGYEWFIDYHNAHNARGGIDDPDSIRYIGLAAAQYARWKRNSGQFSFLVNRLYPKALKLEENYWPARLESARLFLEKYNDPQAAVDLTAALAINPGAAEVHAAAAQLALVKFDLAAASESLDRALEANPHLLMAHQLRADVLIVQFRAAEAIDVLEQARVLNPRDEDTLGRLAAVYGVLDGLEKDGPETRMGAVIAEATARNEHCGQFFLALATTLDNMRKFPAAARYYEEAQKRMPQLVTVHGDLGLMYMRLGDEARAAPLLREAFKIDPFHVRIKNTLSVLNVLQDYAVIETDHFVIRFDRGQDELLARYAARYLEEEAYPQLVERLGYELREKALFEIFSRARGTSGHGWFSVRMAGVPYVGTVGACGGKMVAIVSPGDIPKPFHWARVLKHELTHVINLQQTDFNVPPWYTEATAVLSEGFATPPAWNEILARRVAEGNLFTLDNLNMGFVRPASSDDWTLAYYQATLYVRYLAETYGDDVPGKMLAAYGDNLSTREALAHSCGVEQEEIEAGYRRYVESIAASFVARQAAPPRPLSELLRTAEENPDDADAAASLAYAYLQRNDTKQAAHWAETAREKNPKQQVACYVSARLMAADDQREEALALLREGVDQSAPREEALALLAALEAQAGNIDEAAKLYTLGADTFVRSDRWLAALGRLYLNSNQDDKLATTLVAVCQRDPDDLFSRKKLAQLASQRGDHEEAARWATQAIYIDVSDAEVHALLGKALVAGGKRDRAIQEYEVAVMLDRRNATWQKALAELYLDAGRKDDARPIVEALHAADPDSDEVNRLLERLNH